MHANEQRRKIVVGTASVNWGFDPYYTWVTPPPFDRLLDEMHAAGYAGTEISYNFPMDLDALRGRACAARAARRGDVSLGQCAP